MQLPPALGEDEFTPLDIVFKIYSDGTVRVDYYVEADPSRIRVDLPLFGIHLDNLLILDQDGLPLDSIATETGVVVDSLGAMSLNVTYFTSSLTTKIGVVWSLNVTSPISTKIVLPQGATIFDLSDIPLDIGYEEDRPQVTMEPGHISVSYIIGATSTRDKAMNAIYDAENYIQDAISQGLNLMDAEVLLEEAKEAYDQKQYEEASQLADQAMEQATNTVETASSASEMIDRASDTIASARDSGRVVGLTELEVRLRDATGAYERGEYDETLSIATHVWESALVTKAPNKLIPFAVGGAFVIGAAVLWLYMKRSKEAPVAPGGVGKVDVGAPRDETSVQKGPPTKELPDQVDLRAIFEEHPDLRLVDKEVIRFLAECGGEAFANEIRKRFDMPRSSAWRMVRRLIGEDILEEQKIGGQSLIKVRKEYLKS